MLQNEQGLTPERERLLFGGYYAGVSFALACAAILMVGLRRQIVKDSPGIVVFIMCLVLAFTFLVAFFVFAQHELMLALNHLVYHAGVMLYFWLNLNDHDYQLNVPCELPRAVFVQKLLLVSLLIINLIIVTMWITKSCVGVAWTSGSEAAFIALLNVVYILCLVYYILHMYTLVKISYSNNPYLVNPCMVYLMLLFFVALAVEIIAFAIIAATMEEKPNSSLFPGLVYVFADTVYFIAVMFFVSAHTHRSGLRSSDLNVVLY